MKIWVLKHTEYEGQCTGFSQFETLVGLFTEKPSVEILAPFLKGLNENMGHAIGEVSSLVNSGELILGNHDGYSLYKVDTGKDLT